MDLELRGGAITHDPRLDRLVQFDERSRGFGVRPLLLQPITGTLKAPRSYTHRVEYWLNQGQEGRCVEYSICHELLARPAEVDPELVTQILQGKRIYWPAQQDDQWPGGSYTGAVPQYEGTSVLSGVKTAAKLGFYGEYRWAFTLEEAVVALPLAPLVLGINWYTGMFDTDGSGFVRPTGRIEGGHAILAHSVKIVWKDIHAPKVWDNVNLDQSYIVLHNSWGNQWGLNGRAKLLLTDFDKLRREDGEVAIITKRYRPTSCTWIELVA